ncbi:hypothetical protein HT585_19770 [Ensifer sp. HO-A22]|uniref:Uncharacterized protein n=1 Tax=Ensifer oleiphilus TaxID=2742698 RepID=A0A7Y6UPD3_9HYPH|nr:hypothetical protein [Ensifer oleiphilus]NVD41117.1 hypothetical protein [Ensifer oleiphilus]
MRASICVRRCSISVHPMFSLAIFGTTFFKYFFSEFSLSTLISRSNQAFEPDTKWRICASRTPPTTLARLRISLASGDTRPKNALPATPWMINEIRQTDHRSFKIDKN